MAFLRIKDWLNTITAFRTGDYIAVDGPSGTAKMGKDNLLNEAAQNSLAGNIVQAFDPTKPDDSDGFAYYINDEVAYNGKLYRFATNHSSGAWNTNHVVSIHSINELIARDNLIKNLKLAYNLKVVSGEYVEDNSYRMGVIDANKLRGYKLSISSGKNTFYGLRYAFIKSFSSVAGDQVEFCESCDVVVMAPDTQTFSIVPGDCSYILVWLSTPTYPFSEIEILSYMHEVELVQSATIEPEIYFRKKISQQYYTFESNDNSMVLVYPITGYSELYLNYDNTFNASNDFNPVYFADKDMNPVGSILKVNGFGTVRIFEKNKKIDKFPAGAMYIVMVGYEHDTTASINCITTKPIKNDSRLFRKLQPTRHNGTFFYQADWTYRNNWRLNAFDYNVSGLSYVMLDHCISIEQGGPYECVFKLSDDSYVPVWGRTSYVRYGGKYLIPVPSNAVSLIVNTSMVPGKSYYLPRAYSLENEEVETNYRLDDILLDEHKSVNLFFIGNSLTQDAVSYLPLLLREVCPDIEFNIYMWYCGGYTLKKQWENKIDPNVDATCEIFSICNTDISWVNASVKMSSIALNIYFDLICLQEYFNYVESYTAADTIYFNNIVNYIAGLVDFKFEVDCLFHAPKRGDNFESIYTMTKNGNIVILKNTPAVDIFVPGCAIYEACKTSLDALGDLGHLSPDGTHAQEGLPCLLEAYVMLLQILNKLGRPMTIEGVTSVVDNTNYSSINVPGPNLGSGVVVGTSSDYELAKQISASSCNKRFAILSETF